jgi:hypothetical protein
MLYLAYLDGHDLGPSPEGPWQGLHVLRPGLTFIASDQSRSAVYHALKDHLPHGTALLVAACDEVPKFKGMAAGALTFARHHVGAGRGS